MTESTLQNPPGGGRRNPWDRCRQSAQEAARTRQSVSSCPYRTGAWQTVWLRTFEQEQQIRMID